MVFFEPLIKQLNKKHNVLCTSRDYSEAKNLANIRNINVKVVGKFGGADKAGKLLANSIQILLLAFAHLMLQEYHLDWE